MRTSRRAVHDVADLQRGDRRADTLGLQLAEAKELLARVGGVNATVRLWDPRRGPTVGRLVGPDTKPTLRDVFKSSGYSLPNSFQVSGISAPHWSAGTCSLVRSGCFSGTGSLDQGSHRDFVYPFVSCYTVSAAPGQSVLSLCWHTWLDQLRSPSSGRRAGWLLLQQ